MNKLLSGELEAGRVVIPNTVYSETTALINRKIKKERLSKFTSVFEDIMETMKKHDEKRLCDLPPNRETVRHVRLLYEQIRKADKSNRNSYELAKQRDVWASHKYGRRPWDGDEARKKRDYAAKMNVGSVKFWSDLKSVIQMKEPPSNIHGSALSDVQMLASIVDIKYKVDDGSTDPCQILSGKDIQDPLNTGFSELGTGSDKTLTGKETEVVFLTSDYDFTAFYRVIQERFHVNVEHPKLRKYRP